MAEEIIKTVEFTDGKCRYCGKPVFNVTYDVVEITETELRTEVTHKTNRITLCQLNSESPCVEGNDHKFDVRNL